MKYIITISVLLSSFAVTAQNPKKHIYHDTVKTVQERIEFSPDTIPVFFAEVVVDTSGWYGYDGYSYQGGATVHLIPGFVIWQTYKKAYSLTLIGGGSFSTISQDYYVDEYRDSAISGKFLYLNKKPVTNKVIYSIKR